MSEPTTTSAALRAAIKTALDGHTAADSRVYPSRVDSVSGDSLRKKGPCLCIYTASRTDEFAGSGLYNRVETIAIEGFASGTTDAEAGDAADELEGQVRDVLLSDRAWLPVLADGLRPAIGSSIESRFGEDGGGDRVIAFVLAMPFRYRVTFSPADTATRARDIDVATDPKAGHETESTVHLSDVPAG